MHVCACGCVGRRYEKRGLLDVRRVVDCKKADDPSSWLLFRVYGTVLELHPKLLWTQACGESGGSARTDFRDEFDAAELERLSEEDVGHHIVDGLRTNAVVHKVGL